MTNSPPWPPKHPGHPSTLKCDTSVHTHSLIKPQGSLKAKPQGGCLVATLGGQRSHFSTFGWTEVTFQHVWVDRGHISARLGGQRSQVTFQHVWVDRGHRSHFSTFGWTEVTGHISARLGGQRSQVTFQHVWVDRGGHISACLGGQRWSHFSMFGGHFGWTEVTTFQGVGDHVSRCLDVITL